MKHPKVIDDVIARRELILVSPGQGERGVEVFFGRPRRDTRRGGDYLCEWQAPELGTGHVYTAYGIDEVQALELALQMAGITLQTCREAVTGRLFWLERGLRDLGFPGRGRPPGPDLNMSGPEGAA